MYHFGVAHVNGHFGQREIHKSVRRRTAPCLRAQLAPDTHPLVPPQYKLKVSAVLLNAVPAMNGTHLPLTTWLIVRTAVFCVFTSSVQENCSLYVGLASSIL